MSKAKTNKVCKPLATPASIAGLVQTAGTTAPAKKEKAPVVALRGGSAISTVTTTGAKPYRTMAKHNVDWYAQVVKACAKEPAPVADLIKAGVPSHFLGYCVRRGYAVGV